MSKLLIAGHCILAVEAAAATAPNYGPDIVSLTSRWDDPYKK